MSGTCCCGCGDTPPAHCLRTEIERLEDSINWLSAEILKRDAEIERLRDEAYDWSMEAKERDWKL